MIIVDKLQCLSLDFLFCSCSKVDENSEYDSVEQWGRDAEEKYFDADESQSGYSEPELEKLSLKASDECSAETVVVGATSPRKSKEETVVVGATSPGESKEETIATVSKEREEGCVEAAAENVEKMDSSEVG